MTREHGGANGGCATRGWPDQSTIQYRKYGWQAVMVPRHQYDSSGITAKRSRWNEHSCQRHRCSSYTAGYPVNKPGFTECHANASSTLLPASLRPGLPCCKPRGGTHRVRNKLNARRVSSNCRKIQPVSLRFLFRDECCVQPEKPVRPAQPIEEKSIRNLPTGLVPMPPI
jgi:hypothetical protein